LFENLNMHVLICKRGCAQVGSSAPQTFQAGTLSCSLRCFGLNVMNGDSYWDSNTREVEDEEEVKILAATGPARGRPPNAVKAHFTQTGDPKGLSKRRDHVCNYCHEVVCGTAAKTETLAKHLVRGCKDVPDEVKDAFLLYVSYPEEAATPLGKKDGTWTKKTGEPLPAASAAKKAKLQSRIGSFVDTNLPAQLQASIERKQLLAFVACGISFNVAEAPFFLDFLSALRPMYRPPGKRSLL